MFKNLQATQVWEEKGSVHWSLPEYYISWYPISPNLLICPDPVWWGGWDTILSTGLPKHGFPNSGTLGHQDFPVLANPATWISQTWALGYLVSQPSPLGFSQSFPSSKSFSIPGPLGHLVLDSRATRATWYFQPSPQPPVYWPLPSPYMEGLNWQRYSLNSRNDFLYKELTNEMSWLGKSFFDLTRHGKIRLITTHNN